MFLRREEIIESKSVMLVFGLHILVCIPNFQKTRILVQCLRSTMPSGTAKYTVWGFVHASAIRYLLHDVNKELAI